MTKILDARDLRGPQLADLLKPAVEALQNGDAIGMPTETVYGLAANALSADSTTKIYKIKDRPNDNPLIVHISGLEMLRVLVPPRLRPLKDTPGVLGELQIPENLIPVLEKFWPGPLTVLLRRIEGLPDVVTAGLATVAVRFPAHPVAQALIAQSGLPLAAPSANLSGRPSPTTAKHVMEDLDGRVDYIVDGGPCELGLESTVLDATRDPPLILRPGVITEGMLREHLPTVCVFNSKSGSTTKEEIKAMQERPPTPGMKYRHYSPTSPLFLFTGCETDHQKKAAAIMAFVKNELQMGKSVIRLLIRGAPLTANTIANYSELVLSETGDSEEIARNLFAGLRAADTFRPDLIIAESVVEDGEGLAIMNRLEKASSNILQII